jgi:hypothetical protein
MDGSTHLIQSHPNITLRPGCGWISLRHSCRVTSHACVTSCGPTPLQLLLPSRPLLPPPSLLIILVKDLAISIRGTGFGGRRISRPIECLAFVVKGPMHRISRSQPKCNLSVIEGSMAACFVGFA